MGAFVKSSSPQASGVVVTAWRAWLDEYVNDIKITFAGGIDSSALWPRRY